MSNNLNIEDQFKNAFEHFEADVNPQVWTGIEQNLPGVPTQAVDVTSIAKGIVGSGSKLSLLTVGIAATILTGIVAVSYILFNASKPETTVITTNATAKKAIEAPVTVGDENIVSTNENFQSLRKEEKVDFSSIAQNNKASNSTQTDIQSDIKTNEIATTQPVDVKVNESVPNAVSSDKKNTDPVISISSADEKHENISSPAVDAENINAAKSNTNESFDWGVIPNAFSPNADGKNDVFKITNPNIETIKVTILDRNGKQVHEWSGINGFWDGKDINGNDLPKGVYYYFIFATSSKGEALKTKGTITLLR